VAVSPPQLLLAQYPLATSSNLNINAVKLQF
jgi:hypothetical protein